MCYVFVALTLKSLLSHINVTHSRSPDFCVVCGIDGCAKEYWVYNSFWYHIKRCHGEHLMASSRAASRQVCQGSTVNGNEGRIFWTGPSTSTINLEHGDSAAVGSDTRNCTVEPLSGGRNDRTFWHF